MTGQNTQNKIRFYIFNKGLALCGEVNLEFVEESLEKDQYDLFLKTNFHDNGNFVFMAIYGEIMPWTV